MAKAAVTILPGNGDVRATMTQLKKTQEGIYTQDVKPKLKSRPGHPIFPARRQDIGRPSTFAADDGGTWTRDAPGPGW